MSIRTIGIVGLGPRGMSVLERLVENARHCNTADFTIHAIDSDALGSGSVWRPQQSRDLLMNTVASQVTLFTDLSVTCRGPIVPGPSLHEWARDPVRRAELRESDPQLETEAARLAADDYPTRALYGKYLHWVFDHITTHLPSNVHLITHIARVTAVTPLPGGRYAIHTAADTGDRIVVDQAVLALGHLPGLLGQRERALQIFAAQHRLTYIPPANPADVDLTAIEAGSTVLVRGLGLNFFDYLSLLTTGRGGHFVRTSAGLTYLASGAEPRIHAGSRRGVPYHARGRNQKGVTGRHQPRFLTPTTISYLQQRADTEGGLDFLHHVWPLVSHEVEFVYYMTLQRRHGRGDHGQLEREILAAVAAKPAAKTQRLRRLGITPAQQWDWDRIAAPCRHAPLDDHDKFTRWLLDHLYEDVHNAREGNVDNPLKAALDVMRDVRNEVRQLVDHGRVSAQSYRDYVYTAYTPLNGFVSIGPPAHRIEELIALINAGVITIAGPNFTVEPHREGRFTGYSPDIPGSRRDCHILVEARLPAQGVWSTDDPLITQLIDEGVARYHTLAHPEVEYRTGSLDVTKRPYRVIDRHGSPHQGLYAFGVPTEGVHWATAAGVRPGFDSVILGDADAIAHTVLGLDERRSPAAVSSGSARNVHRTMLRGSHRQPHTTIRRERPTLVDTSERHRAGDQVRREILGDEYVNTMLHGWDPAKPLLELITEYSWGYLWIRDQLDKQTRSLITVALLTALNRPNELRLHVGGALTNGCSVEQLAEVALQGAVYAGIPAGIDAMKIIRQEVDATAAVKGNGSSTG
jgi:alkylhydroperoxidase/carboxymuconolactone decarboxylase family protein YurZ